MYVFFVFFFQAEDGIRDLYVTGVQTCASSDLQPHPQARGSRGGEEQVRADAGVQVDQGRRARGRRLLLRAEAEVGRSEERRVGKECRSRWWVQHYNKKRSELHSVWSCLWYVGH